MKVGKVHRVRRYKKWGFVLKDEEWFTGFEDKPKDHTILMKKIAYTEDGQYIGDSKWAYRLCVIRGIKPEKRLIDNSVCSIGFSAKDQRWWGWSHRGIYGFGIGATCKKGDCSYKAKNKKEWIEAQKAFWFEKDYHDTKCEEITKTYCTHTMDDPSGAKDPDPKAIGICCKQIPDPSTEVTESGIELSWKYKREDKSVYEQLGIFNAFPKSYGRGEWTAETLEDAKQMAIDFAEGVR